MESRWIARKLTEMGYRLTPQRILVLRALEEADDHISADEIFIKVRERYPNMNISTVYRTLELAGQLGLVTQTVFADGRVRFHCAGKGHHHHLVCEQCGRIIDLDEHALDSLWKSLQEHYNFDVKMKHMAIFGVCDKCRDK
jgi:Fur family transcriptional regulator, ferric uptake regulator